MARIRIKGWSPSSPLILPNLGGPTSKSQAKVVSEPTHILNWEVGSKVNDGRLDAFHEAFNMPHTILCMTKHLEHADWAHLLAGWRSMNTIYTLAYVSYCSY